MGSRKSQGNFLYLPQQDILVTSQGFFSPDSFFLFSVAVLGRSGAWKQNGFLLMRSFCSGKTIYLEQNGARKGFCSA